MEELMNWNCVVLRVQRIDALSVHGRVLRKCAVNAVDVVRALDVKSVAGCCSFSRFVDGFQHLCSVQNGVDVFVPK